MDRLFLNLIRVIATLISYSHLIFVILALNLKSSLGLHVARLRRSRFARSFDFLLIPSQILIISLRFLCF